MEHSIIRTIKTKQLDSAVNAIMTEYRSYFEDTVDPEPLLPEHLKCQTIKGIHSIRNIIF